MCTQPITLLDAVDSLTDGDAVDLGRNFLAHTVIVSATGVPDYVQVRFDISHDALTWVQVLGAEDSHTPLVGHVERAARYIRARLTVLNGGTSPTVTVTVASVGGGI